MFFVFFTNVENVKKSVLEALIICFENFIPTIFPFMIISLFFLYLSGFSAHNLGVASRIFDILGICKRYVFHIFIGSLCGFVTGAKAICEDYAENDVEKEDFSNSVILSSNAGIGFVVGFIGVKLWGSFYYGIFLFAVQIIVALILNMLILRHSKGEEKFDSSASEKTVFDSLTTAISTSGFSIITICAFVVFFSTLINVTASFFGISKSSPLFSFIFILIEFCQGSVYAVSYDAILVCAFFTGFVIGFGGICVHFQIFSVCSGFPLKKMQFFTFKLLQGIICGIISLGYVYIANLEPMRDVFLRESTIYTHFIAVPFSLLVLPLLCKKIFSKKKF